LCISQDIRSSLDSQSSLVFKPNLISFLSPLIHLNIVTPQVYFLKEDKTSPKDKSIKCFANYKAKRTRKEKCQKNKTRASLTKMSNFSLVKLE
jgi:hypothetical protein